MQYIVGLPQFNLSEICFQAWKGGLIREEHRQELRSVLLNDTISEPDCRIINRLLYAVRRGWLGVED
ncbi:MAG: hypothetical protein MUC60_18545 [Oscillatoria sp. Prado101]|jgi:hypothetical protein|nr:hypothetical protein [Oscillatoria sp. Prado101]